MKYLLFFISIHAFISGFSQTFSYTFNYGIDFDYGAESAGIVEEWNGGYILIGGGNVWGTDLFRALKLVHLSDSGKVIWKKYMGRDEEAWWSGGGSSNSSFWDMEGNFIVGGSVSNANNESDGLIYKFDQNFDTLWTLRLDNSRWDIFYGACLAPDSNYLFIGSTIFPVGTSKNFWLVKVSPTGQLIWQKTYDSFKDDRGISVQIAPDSGLFISGTSYTSTESGGWLIKTDRYGKKMWDRDYFHKNPSCGIVMNPTQDGNYIMAHCEGIQYEPGHHDPVAVIAKITPEAQTIWKCYFSEERETSIAHVKEIWDHYYLVTGIKRQVVLNIVSPWAALVDSAGHLVWEHEYSLGQGGGYLYDGIATADSGIFLTGSVTSFDSVGHNSDFWALKVGPNGCLTENCSLNALEAAAPKSWKLYPNPARDMLWVEVPQNRRVYSFKIIDLLGREILREDLLPQINTHQLNISTLTSGIYWLVALDAEGQLLTSEKFFRK